MSWCYDYQYCERQAERMYPEIYHRIYPHVRRMCEREDHPNNSRMYPFPSVGTVDELTDRIYNEYQNEYSESHEEQYDEYYRIDGRIFPRDLIRILLLRELLGRRRRRRFPYYPYYNYPYYNYYY